MVVIAGRFVVVADGRLVAVVDPTNFHYRHNLAVGIVVGVAVDDVVVMG